MEVVVTGIGLVSALGDRETSWKHLLAGKTAVRQHQPFAELPPSPIALIHHQPSTLETLTEPVVLAALRDAGLQPPLSNCAIVLGSSRGNQAQWEALARGQRGLENWLETLPHAAAVRAAQLVGTEEAVRSPMAACATGLWAIAQGVELIQSGQSSRVLAGAIEAPITPLTLTGFRQMGALASTGAYPFDRDREGLALGEGGAVLVLESAELAQQRGAKVYGKILGFGLTADGYHVSAPEPGSAAAIAAVRQCLDRSQLHSDQIGYIHAHGTATPLNDRNEAHLIQQMFPQGVPVSSTKGATGHTIGASGAIGAALCLLALRDQLLPPTVGLRHSEFDLDLVTAARPAGAETALCLGFGFGGQNAAIALSRVNEPGAHNTG